MLLDARQKTANARIVRSSEARFSSCWANMRPTKRARFFVHCLGRIDNSNARKRLPVPDLEDLIALVVLEECNPFCSSVCCSCVAVKFSKSYSIPSTPKNTIPVLPLLRTAIRESNNLTRVFELGCGMLCISRCVASNRLYDGA